MTSEIFIVIQTDTTNFNPADIQVFSTINIQNYQSSLQIENKVSIIFPWSVNLKTPKYTTGNVLFKSFGIEK